METQFINFIKKSFKHLTHIQWWGHQSNYFSLNPKKIKYIMTILSQSRIVEAIVFFFQFCDIGPFAIIHKYLDKFGNIQNMI